MCSGACDNLDYSQVVEIQLSNPQNEEVGFFGQFGRDDKWIQMAGSTPRTYSLDLRGWTSGSTEPFLGTVRKTTSGRDELRLQVIRNRRVVLDTGTVVRDSVLTFFLDP
jgi:hypothetical protein